MNLRNSLWTGLLVGGLIACNAPGKSDPAPTAEAAHKAITTETLEPYTCGSIQKMHTLGGVFLASQPTEADFEQAKLGGVRTVINIRKPGELAFDEAAVVQNLGLNYLNPAWNGAEELTDDVFAEYRTLLNVAERPILLHCGSANRVGAVWLPWRVLDQGATVAEALEEAKTIGLKSPDYQAKALEYVQRMQK